MGIRLVFLAKNKLFMIAIEGRKIIYNDSIQKLQELYPNPSKKALRLFGPPTKEELAEYNMCKTEKELMSFVIKDCKKAGAKLIKKEMLKDGKGKK